MSARGDEPAFPFNQVGFTPEWGLTKREWFAGMAMQGLLAEGVRFVANDARLEADDMLTELSKPQEPGT